MKQRTVAQVEQLPCIFFDMDGVVYYEEDCKERALLEQAYNAASSFIDKIFIDNHKIKTNE